METSLVRRLRKAAERTEVEHRNRNSYRDQKETKESASSSLFQATKTSRTSYTNEEVEAEFHASATSNRDCLQTLVTYFVCQTNYNFIKSSTQHFRLLATTRLPVHRLIRMLLRERMTLMEQQGLLPWTLRLPLQVIGYTIRYLPERALLALNSGISAMTLVTTDLPILHPHT